MTDSEFIDLCYERILGRPAEDSAKATLLAALAAGHATLDSFVSSLLRSPEFEAQLSSREAFPAGHYFSALPSGEERARYFRNTKQESIPGVDLRTEEQTALARKFAVCFADCPLTRGKGGSLRYHADNFSFPLSDAFVLYCFIRTRRSRRIVEVGSGFSSAAILDSLDSLNLSGTHCTFVEPYPKLLQSLLRGGDERHTILPIRVQDADPAIFESLCSGDILFIDSTHVSKLDSDVNREVFEILPRLKPGVLVHFHDIYWPFDYPEEWVREGRAWNEAYLVRAFMQFNSAFRILYFNSFLHPKIRFTLFADAGVDIGPNDGGSLWLERV